MEFQSLLRLSTGLFFPIMDRKLSRNKPSNYFCGQTTVAKAERLLLFLFCKGEWPAVVAAGGSLPKAPNTISTLNYRKYINTNTTIQIQFNSISQYHSLSTSNSTKTYANHSSY